MIEAADTLTFMGGSMKHGRLTLIDELRPQPVEREDGRRFIRRGHFRCDCGNERTAELRNVRRGLTRSCGCLNKDRARRDKAQAPPPA